MPSFLKKGSKTKLVPVVSSARATKIICEKWKSNTPYCCGGIYTGEDINNIMKLGASGVQMGTRFRNKHIRLEPVDLRWCIVTTSVNEDEREATVLKAYLEEIEKPSSFSLSP